MPFVLGSRFSGGKLIWRVLPAKPLRTLQSAPPVHGGPPDQAQPFIDAGLGPLAMRPPTRPELRVIIGGSNREVHTANLMTEYAERSAGGEVGGDDQNPIAAAASQAFSGVERFILRGKAIDRANLHRSSLRKPLHIPIRQINVCKSVDACCSGHIDNDAPAITCV